jgi:ferredoxin
MTESKNTIGNTGLRVFVDPKRCVANGKCTYAAPGVYVIDEETGVAYVDDEDRATVENLFAGARACPTDAIILEQYGRRVYPRILAPMSGETRESESGEG